MAEWFKRGEGAFERFEKFERERDDNSGPHRFFLKPGGSAKITFLDSDGFGFLEHNLKLDGRWGHHYTCLRDFSECPICDAGFKPSWVMVWTIIDHSRYVSERTGKEYRNTKKLFVAKQAVINKLKRRKESLDGDLTFALFDIRRDTHKECSTGEDIEFLKRLSVDDIVKLKPEGMTQQEWLQPFDYVKIFEPKSVDMLRRLINAEPPIGADDDGLETPVSLTSLDSIL